MQDMEERRTRSNYWRSYRSAKKASLQAILMFDAAVYEHSG